MPSPEPSPEPSSPAESPTPPSPDAAPKPAAPGLDPGDLQMAAMLKAGGPTVPVRDAAGGDPARDVRQSLQRYQSGLREKIRLLELELARLRAALARSETVTQAAEEMLRGAPLENEEAAPAEPSEPSAQA